MRDICTECEHPAESHRPSDPDGIWECHQQLEGSTCDCPEFVPPDFDPDSAALVINQYGPASAQVMSPDQLEDADEVERAHAAQQLLVSGHTWQEIAQMTGYSSAAAAKMSVRTMRQRAALALDADLRREMLDLEMDRLTEMLRAYWPTAMAGEVKHAEFVLKVIAQQAKMLGLEELHTQTQQSSRTIIIAGDPANYANMLRQIAQAG